MNRLFTILGLLGCGILFLPSCKKLVEVSTPINYISSENVFSTDATAAAVLTGIYTNMSQSYFPEGGIISMSLFPGLSADDFALYGGVTDQMYIGYYTNALSNSNIEGNDFWNQFYPTIYTANSAISGLSSSSTLTPAVKQQLLGEAKFIRAFCYFYLINLYGDVPLALNPNYNINDTLRRTPKATVWEQVISDLSDAKSELSSQYLDATLLKTTTERTRPTKWAAMALLSRVYLYNQNWTAAEAEADSVIGNTTLYGLDSLNGVFLSNSTEAIWQLQPVLTGENTQDALLFIVPGTGPSDVGGNPVYMSNNLLASFEPGDGRRANWVDSVVVGSDTFYFPYKYKDNTIGDPVTEYEMVLRLGEQYLIRAEARAQQGNIGGSQGDINVVRNRADLASTNDGTQASLLTDVLHERQVELFSEWGHRWLDLKRAAIVDSVMGIVTPEKGGIWSSFKQWYPIPLTELQHNPNLVQNEGY